VSWLQPEDITVQLRCESCGGAFEWVEMPACASAHHGPHPHARCPSCSPKWWAACVMIKGVSAGEAAT
jgi:hypothetical protein